MFILFNVFNVSNVIIHLFITCCVKANITSPDIFKIFCPYTQQRYKHYIPPRRVKLIEEGKIWGTDGKCKTLWLLPCTSSGCFPHSTVGMSHDLRVSYTCDVLQMFFSFSGSRVWMHQRKATYHTQKA